MERMPNAEIPLDAWDELWEEVRPDHVDPAAMAEYATLLRQDPDVARRALPAISAHIQDCCYDCEAMLGEVLAFLRRLDAHEEDPELSEIGLPACFAATFEELRARFELGVGGTELKPADRLARAHEDPLGWGRD